VVTRFLYKEIRVLLCWAAVDFSASGNLFGNYSMDGFVVTDPSRLREVKSWGGGNIRCKGASMNYCFRDLPTTQTT
jgi:hypothetical protein